MIKLSSNLSSNYSLNESSLALLANEARFNSFYASVYSYHRRNGFITQKQYNALRRSLQVSCVVTDEEETSNISSISSISSTPARSIRDPSVIINPGDIVIDPNEIRELFAPNTLSNNSNSIDLKSKIYSDIQFDSVFSRFFRSNVHYHALRLYGESLGWDGRLYALQQYYIQQLNKLPEYTLPDAICDLLKPFQVPLVEDIVKKMRGGVRSQLLAWDLGAGKTYGAAAVIAALGVPVFVICPKTVCTKWKSVLELFGVSVLGIANYESAVRGKMINFRPYRSGPKRAAGLLKEESVECPYIVKIPASGGSGGRGVRGVRGVSFEFRLPGNALILFDELHRCKNIGSLNSKLSIAARIFLNANPNAYGLGLTGTLAESPIKTWGSGFFLGLYDSKNDYNQLIDRFGAGNSGYNASRSFDYPNKYKNINIALFPRLGSRIAFRDIPGAPDQSISVEFIDPAEPLNSLHALALVGAKSRVERLSREETLILKQIGSEIAVELDIPNSSIAQLLRERQLRELEKLGYIVEQIEQSEENERFVVFLNYSQSITILQCALCARRISSEIYSGQTLQTRAESQNRFQNQQIKVLICNLEAAKEGIDLHDTSSGHSYPRIALFSPSYTAQSVSQALGRIHRVGGGFATQKFIVCSGTIEESVWSIISLKLDNLDDLNEGQRVLTSEIARVEKSAGAVQTRLLLADLDSEFG